MLEILDGQLYDFIKIYEVGFAAQSLLFKLIKLGRILLLKVFSPVAKNTQNLSDLPC